MIYHIRLAMEFYDNLGKVLSEMPGISLDEMSGVRLMNRTDTKFLANKSLLLKFFELAKNDYFVQKTDGSPVYPNHHSKFDFDERVMKVMMKLFCHSVMYYC